jgi:hypothetical protein
VPLGERAERSARIGSSPTAPRGIAADMAYRGNMKKRMAKGAMRAARALRSSSATTSSSAAKAQVKDLASTGEQRGAVALDLLAARRCARMTSISAERIAQIEARREELQAAMSAPRPRARRVRPLSKDYAEIEPVAAAAREVRRLRAELES